MPKKIDPAVKERAVRRVLEHRAEYSSLTAAAAAVAKQERLGAESVRRWVLQAEEAASKSYRFSDNYAPLHSRQRYVGA